MIFQTLLVEDRFVEGRNAIRLITLNRPDKLNALNQESLRELQSAFEQAKQADSVRVVVLTGAGTKAFVAGADISEMSGLSPVQAREFSRLGQRLMLTIERLGKPVIAMINGFALGGGMELAMACHLRIASETAKLGQPEVNLGLIPGFGGTQRLLRLAGRSAALELCLLGQQIDAARALSLNLLTRVVPSERLELETMTLAQHLAVSAPLALRGVLDAVLVGSEASLDTALDYETQVFSVAFSTHRLKSPSSP